jgi:hypothetical protein
MFKVYEISSSTIVSVELLSTILVEMTSGLCRPGQTLAMGLLENLRQEQGGDYRYEINSYRFIGEESFAFEKFSWRGQFTQGREVTIVRESISDGAKITVMIETGNEKLPEDSQFFKQLFSNYYWSLITPA